MENFPYHLTWLLLPTLILDNFRQIHAFLQKISTKFLFLLILIPEILFPKWLYLYCLLGTFLCIMWFLVKIAHFKKLKQFLLYAFFLRKQKTRKPRTKCIHFVINYPYFKIHNWFCTNSCNSCSNPHQDWAESSVNWFRKKLIYQNWFPKFKHFDWVIAKLVLILAKQKAQIWENTYWEISFYVINQ